MRPIILFFLFLLLAACQDKKKEDNPPCAIRCSDPSFIVKINSLPADSSMSQRLRIYEKNGQFNNLVDDQAVVFGPLLEPAYDYEIYLVAMDKSFRISNVTFDKRSETGISTNKGCMGTCFNRLNTMTVTFEGQARTYKFEQTNTREFTLFL